PSAHAPGFDCCAKSDAAAPAIASAPIVSGALPELVIVADFAALLVPTICEPNASVGGAAASTAAPEADSVTVTLSTTASSMLERASTVTLPESPLASVALNVNWASAAPGRLADAIDATC